MYAYYRHTLPIIDTHMPIIDTQVEFLQASHILCTTRAGAVYVQGTT